MKKIALLLIAVSLMLNGVSCGGSGESNDTEVVEVNSNIAPSELADKIKAAYPDYLVDTDIDADVLEAMFGVSPELVESFVGQMPFIGFNSDILIVIKAQDGKAAEVAAALNAYKTDRIDLANDYAEHMPKIRAAEIYSAGNYVFYISLGQVDQTLTDEDPGALDFYKEKNKKAIEVIDAALGIS